MNKIILMGASAGGVETFRKIIPKLPPDLHAAVFLIMHMGSESPGRLPAILSRHSDIEVVEVSDNAAIEAGRVYVAAPDQHLTFFDSKMCVHRGPKENRHRPSIDTAFRSAAKNFGDRVIAVVLSGLLDDGSCGISLVQKFGGTAIVQDPEDALYPSMPRSAMETVHPDYVAPADAIPELLSKLAETPVSDKKLPRTQKLEPDAKKDGKPSEFTCPECHGTLWEAAESNGTNFECRIGHRYSARSLMADSDGALENALWVALRNLEESAALSQRLADRVRERGLKKSAQQYLEQAHIKRHHANTIRKILTFDLPKAANE